LTIGESGASAIRNTVAPPASTAEENAFADSSETRWARVTAA
jgi:hypothetical protein